MAQYDEIKAKHPDTLLLFRVGDFYETFDEDAKRSSQVLGITLTKRSNGAASDTALAGFPFHALDTYLPKLIRSGLKVAICEQLEEASPGKKLVRRGVTELVSPGVHLRDSILEDDQNNYLAAFSGDERKGALAFLDFSTGEFLLTEGTKEQLSLQLAARQPREVLLDRRKKLFFQEAFGTQWLESYLPDWVCRPAQGEKELKTHFGVENLKGFGLEKESESLAAAGMLIHYLRSNGHHQLDHVGAPSVLGSSEFMWLDDFTMRNLEVLSSTNPDGVSLWEVVDHASTAMGKRSIRRWLGAPLRLPDPIRERHERVARIAEQPAVCSRLGELLKPCIDLERAIARLATRKIHPRELHQLARSLSALEKGFSEIDLSDLFDDWSYPGSAVDSIEQTLAEDPPVQIGKEEVIRTGVDTELDEYRSLRNDSKEQLDLMLAKEVERTGISSLKVGNNQVFGYHFEVRNTHKDKVPEHWQRKQTLVAAERYITSELKEFEERIVHAEARSLERERFLFDRLLEGLLPHIPDLQAAARFVGELDGWNCWAQLAIKNKYVRPQMTEELEVDIKEGRHPVIEQVLDRDAVYVPNDIRLAQSERQMMMITGPNMAGKSALLRQLALSCVLAQAGSFVPADSAVLPILDRLFVRVGASDNISRGESTFMVEMLEAASILNNLQGRCLVLLDEIGRGTSTYDGVSIAWAMASFLHEHPERPLCLFATHYHELNEMSEAYPRIRNMNVAVREEGEKIHFLRKLQEGGSAHSFGIQVARMAGMPQFVLKKAEQLLAELEKSRSSAADEPLTEKKQEWQMSMIQMQDPLLEEIRSELDGLDLNNLTPIEALMILKELQAKTKQS